MTETWSYLSSTSVSIASDVTTTYWPNMKIVLTQNLVRKYFVIYSVTYSAPNTIIVLTPIDGSAVENLPITDHHRSTYAAPSGIPYISSLPHNQDATTITTGSLDGDRLPALSTGKRGGVKETGTPAGKFLRDDDTWATPTGAAHTQNTDQYLDYGGANQVSAVDAKDAVTKKHASSLLGTKTVDETNIANSKIISYNSSSGHLEYISAGTPAAHASTHKGDGTDPIDAATISVAGLESSADKTKLDGIASLADVTATNIAPAIHAANSKTTPIDGDEIGIVDNAASNVLKKLTWANLKATLSGVLSPATHAGTHVSGQTDAIAIATTSIAGLESAADKTKLDGVSAGANVTATALAPAVHAATSKDAPVDADEIGIADSAASYVLKKSTWANLKASLPVATTSVAGFESAADKTKLDGISASADNTATVTHAATQKTTPVNADEIGLVDSAAGNVLKKLTWANLIAAVPSTNIDASQVISGVLDPARLPAATISAQGAMPILSNNSSYFLNGQGAWATPAGGGGGLGYTPVFGETPSGSGTSFTLAHTPVGGIDLFRNGLAQVYTTDYTLSGTSITLVTTLGASEYLRASYSWGSSGGSGNSLKYATKVIGPYGSDSSTVDYVCSNTAAEAKFQEALDAIHYIGGGTLIVKPGVYTFSASAATVTIYPYTTIIGENVPWAFQGPTNANRYISRINVQNTAVPAFTVRSDIAIENLAFFYPLQTQTGTPTAYAPTISTSVFSDSSSVCITIKYCNAGNSYIFFSDSPSSDSTTYKGGSYIIDHCIGWPLYRFAQILHGYAPALVSFIDLNPCMSTGTSTFPGTTLLQWVQANNIEFECNHADGSIFTNVGIFLANIGFRFGSSSGWLDCSDNHIEAVHIGIQFNGAADIRTSNNIIWSYNWAAVPSAEDATGRCVDYESSAHGCSVVNSFLFAGQYSWYVASGCSNNVISLNNYWSATTPYDGGTGDVIVNNLHGI